MNIVEELNRRREEIDASHKAAVEKLGIQYDAQVGEIDRLLALAEGGSRPAPTGARASGTAKPKKKPTPAKPGQKKAGNTRTAKTPPAKASSTPKAATDSKAAVAPSRPQAPTSKKPDTEPPPAPSAGNADTDPSALIDERIIAVLLKNGSMTTAEMQEISGSKMFGPLMSGWKRRARRMGLDLDTCLVRSIDPQSKAVIYTISDKGKEELQPGAKPGAPGGA